MAALLLVRYGELALKSPPVRREFERTLGRNILDQFAANGEPCRIRSDHGHLYVDAEDALRAVRLLRRVFGITSVSEVVEVASDVGSIRPAFLELGRHRLTNHASFAVRARRTGQHPYTSQELAAALGGAILETFAALELRVDLSRPDVELFAEVRGPRAYLYSDRHEGPGGLPLGVAGRVVALVDGPRGALGAWMMMKRGCRCWFVPTASGEPMVREVLGRFDPKAPPAAARDAVAAPEALRSLATETNADGVVLPLSVDDYPTARAAWDDRVVFSPTVGLDDQEVDQRWHAVVQLAS